MLPLICKQKCGVLAGTQLNESVATKAAAAAAAAAAVEAAGRGV
jgi:hypothetical protein